MTDAELKAMRLYFALDLHDNQNTMGTFLKEFIKVMSMLDPPKVYMSLHLSTFLQLNLLTYLLRDCVAWDWFDLPRCLCPCTSRPAATPRPPGWVLWAAC